ncbi:MAG: TonB-dependent receptor domain-containing protein [Gammaproteobacteria bacterium]
MRAATSSSTRTPGTEGNRFHNAPRHAGSLFSTYEVLGGDLNGLKLGGGRGCGGAARGRVSEPFFQLPGYAVVNLLGSYSWRAGPTKLTAQLNVASRAPEGSDAPVIPPCGCGIAASAAFCRATICHIPKR